VITFAVWLTASIVPGIVVYGGFLTYLWVSLLLGLVNAVIGPVAHIIALPVTVVTLGLFALVVNGLLLAVTAALTAGLGVDGFLATVVGATLIASVTAALDFLVNPIRPRPDRL